MAYLIYEYTCTNCGVRKFGRTIVSFSTSRCVDCKKVEFGLIIYTTIVVSQDDYTKFLGGEYDLE